MNKKHHYFIGHMIRFNPSLINSLQKYITSITKNNNITSKHIVHDFHTRFLYLGYLDESTANKLITTKLQPIIEILVKKISDTHWNTECTIQKLKIIGNKSTYQKIALIYHNELIENKIVPLLKKITDDVYGGTKYPFLPHINLMSIKPISNHRVEDIEQKLDYDVEIPKTFNLSSIDILRSSTLKTRSGRSSKNDESIVETLKTYQITPHSNSSTKTSQQKSFMKDIMDMFKV